MTPSTKEFLAGLVGVFLSAAFCTYTWSLVVFFWEIPSFLLRLDWIDILGYGAYQFMFSFIESVTVTAFIGLLSLLLPAIILRSNIRVKGTALVFAFALNSVIFKERLDIIHWLANTMSVETLHAAQVINEIWLVGLIFFPVSLVAATKNKRVTSAINAFVESLSVLISIYVCLSLLGILIVIFRNIH